MKRIINGWEVEAGQWPWLVHLRVSGVGWRGGVVEGWGGGGGGGVGVVEGWGGGGVGWGWRGGGGAVAMAGRRQIF